MKDQVWDAVVIGGGPAGCSAAIWLARTGLRVALFEARAYPHDKLCGEFLSPECGHLLASLGLGNRLAELGPVPIHTACLTAPDGTAWEGCLPGTALGLSRKTLDAELADQARRAGAVVFESAPVRDVQGSLEAGFELEAAGRTVFTRAVIAAHGKRATLDRALGRKFLARRQPYVAIKAHFRGLPIPGRIELHAFPGGYCGLSEIEGGGKVVCLLADERVFQQHRGPGAQGVDRFVHWLEGENLYLRSWLRWAERIHDRWFTIAQIPFLPKPAIERDVLMVGDAAGLIVPLAGNGIAMALEGGLLAAGQTERYLLGEVSAADLRQQYPRAWGKQFGARLRLGRALQPLLMHPRSAGLALRLLNRAPRVGRWLVEHTRGKNAGESPADRLDEFSKEKTNCS